MTHLPALPPFSSPLRFARADTQVDIKRYPILCEDGNDLRLHRTWQAGPLLQEARADLAVYNLRLMLIQNNRRMTPKEKGKRSDHLQTRIFYTEEAIKGLEKLVARSY